METSRSPVPNKMQRKLSRISSAGRQSKSPSKLERLEEEREEQRPVMITRHRYKTEPAKILPEPAVLRIVKDVLKFFFEGIKYDADVFRNLTKKTCNIIRERVKQLDYPRYKIVSFVHAGQNRHQDMRIASRALLSRRFDRYTEYTMQGKDFFVIGVVYGFYFE